MSERSCRVCRTKSDQSALQRWTVQEGTLVADSNKRAEGRGYYVCQKLKCLEILPKTVKINK
jgi:predicted RNA-binding protein YlxR (DUF448 family)